MERNAFYLLLLVALALPSAATTSMLVPAVDTDGKGIITTISAQAIPGTDGGVYVDVEPFVSVETQNSGKTAAKIAAELAGVDLSKHLVLFKVNTSAEIIDGPSGGVAFTLLAYSEFTGKRPRSDFTATGTMELDGSVGKVGGVEGKLEASAAKGVKLFLIPVDQALESGIDLVELGESKYGIQVVEVANAREAVSLAFTPGGTRVTPPVHVTPPLVLENLSGVRTDVGMRWLAEEEFKETAAAAEGLKEFVNASSSTLTAVEKSLNLSRQLLDNGYYYSAANNVFSLKINVEMLLLGFGNTTREEFKSRFDGLVNDSESIVFVDKTTENWQWVTGGQLRWHWAKKRIETMQRDFDVLPDHTQLYRELVLAENWMDAAKKMNSLASQVSGGVELNEYKLRNYAEGLLLEAENVSTGVVDTEVEDHLSTAQQAFSNADYLSSAFDSQFVLAFSAAFEKAGGLTAQEISLSLSNSSLLKSFNNSFWAEEYYAHSLYNLAEANRSGGIEFLVNAVKLQELATAVDSFAANVLVELEKPYSTPVPTPVPSPVNETIPSPSIQVLVTTVPQQAGTQKLIVLASVVVIIAAIVILVLIIRAKWPKPASRFSGERALERLDELLLEGRISEKTYLELKAKYSAKKTVVRKRRAKR